MSEKQLLSDYITKRHVVDVMEEQLKEAKKALSKAEHALIEHLQNNDQTRTGDYEGLGSVTIKSQNVYSIPEEYKEDFYDFATTNEYGEVIKRTIHHKTLSRICNEMIVSGKPLPEYVQSYNLTTIQLNK